jgi:hypothetical protein
MSDTCAPKPQLVNVIAARDKVVHYLDTSPRAHRLHAQRLCNVGGAAWVMTVRDCLPELAAGLEDDVADAVRKVIRSRLPRRIKGVRRSRAA